MSIFPKNGQKLKFLLWFSWNWFAMGKDGWLFSAPYVMTNQDLQKETWNKSIIWRHWLSQNATNTDFFKKITKNRNFPSVIFLKLICIGKRWLTFRSTQCHHKPRPGKKTWKKYMIWLHKPSENYTLQQPKRTLCT